MALNPYPSLNEQGTYNGIIYTWNGSIWVETANTNYSFNQIQINGVDSFNSFKTRNINFQGINLVIYSGGVNTLVFSAQQQTNSSSTFSGGTVSGATNFTGGLTANTISATTYQNLPISGVTNGSGISTSITNGNLTITATGGGSSTGLTSSDYVVQGKLSANQSISANTDVIIQFVDDFDPKNWWNSSTYQFTPTIAGYYNIFVGVWLDNPGVTNNQGNVQVRKNGNSFIIIQNPLNNVTGQAFEASKIVYLNGTTDYVDFTIYQASTGSVNILQGTANGSGTWFSASLIVGGNSAFTGGTITGPTNFTSGLTATTISATTYQNLPPSPVIYKSTTDGTGITGVATEQISSSQLIPANTFAVGDIVRITWRVTKTGTTSSITCKLYVNTTVSLVGAIQLGQILPGFTNSNSNGFQRHLAIKASNNTQTIGNAGTFTDYNTLTAVTTANIDWSINQYIIFMTQLNSATADVVRTSFYLIEKV
jgi:hypothetical protein